MLDVICDDKAKEKCCYKMSAKVLMELMINSLNTPSSKSLIQHKCIFKASHDDGHLHWDKNTTWALWWCYTLAMTIKWWKYKYELFCEFSIQFKQKSSMACCNKFDHVLGILNVRSNSPNGRYLLQNWVLGHWQNEQEIHDWQPFLTCKW